MKLAIIIYDAFSLPNSAFLSYAEIDYVYGQNYEDIRLRLELNAMYQRYGACLNLTIPALENIVAVKVRINLKEGHPEELTALYPLLFGFCGALAIVINILTVETYIYLTKDETERLKRVSTGRRRARGMEISKKLD